MALFIPLRRKILFFSLLLALLPLGFSGFSMILLTQDEIKSAINENLVNASDNLVKELDYLVADGWLPPLGLIRGAVDNPRLGVAEKISLLEGGIQTLEGFWALQLRVEGFPPAQFVKPELAKHLAQYHLESLEAPPPEGETPHLGEPVIIPQSDWRALPIWLALAPINGQPAYLVAYVDLRLVGRLLQHHPFSRGGQVFVLDGRGAVLFATEANTAPDPSLRRAVIALIQDNVSTVSVLSFLDNHDHRRLGSFAVARNLPWAVVTSVREDQAYGTVARMRWQLLGWAVGGLSLAVAVAFWFAARITRPIREVASVAQRVGSGDLSARVRPLRSRDEIAILGEQINAMIRGLLEHFQLQKFVSGDTLKAVQQAGDEGIKLGGERRTVTVFFSDIRGFTAFSEKVSPETVIQMLNTYLRAQAKIVKQYQGDIDKFVGDELVAVFQGEDMVTNAVTCATEIHQAMARLNAASKEQWNLACGIGINSGEVVMGAMGSEDRMDYTILGDTVNLGARLCSHAPPHTTLISQQALEFLPDQTAFHRESLPPLQVKGKSQPIPVVSIRRETLP